MIDSDLSATDQDFIEDSVLNDAMTVQLNKWKDKLDSGHKRVGWKIGFNVKSDQLRMKLETPVIGFLTSETVLNSGDTYKGKTDTKLMVEAELAIHIGKDVSANASYEEMTHAIKGFAPAIEIVDILRSPGDITSILKDNLFHETVILGELNTEINNFMSKDICANVFVNGVDMQSSDHSRYPEDIREVISCVANILYKQGQVLQAGDWIIAGSITQPIEVNSGDEIKVSLSPFDSLLLNIEK